MDGWMDAWMDGWMDGCMDGWMDGWMDGDWGVAAMGQASSLPPSRSSASVIGAPVGVQVPNAPEKGAQQGCSRVPILTMTRVPSPEEISSAQGRGVFSKTVMGLIYYPSY